MESYDLIAGMGQTGLSVARYLTRKKQPFVIFDTRENPSGLKKFQEEFPNVHIYQGVIPEVVLNNVKSVIVSPGVALDHPVMQKLAHLGKPIRGDIEYFAEAVTAPIIGITGTNGKSTVTTLVTELLKASGLSVVMGGNIGVPALDLLHSDIHYDAFVLELSSFQLELTSALPLYAAVILNITEDHLDRHHSFEAYQAVKQRIYTNTKYAVYNRCDSFTKPTLATHKTLSFGLTKPDENAFGVDVFAGTTYLMKGTTRLLSVNDLKMKGCHNWANALAALALVDTMGLLSEKTINVLKEFPGLPHRSQLLRTVDGVDFINDSKGTNVGATISALSGIGESMHGKIILIAGGQGKGASFTPLCEPLTRYARFVVLIGEDATLIDHAIQNVVPFTHANSLEEAVLVAKKNANPGDVVLLSPACASLDMFRDFNHRGESFAAIVESL